MGDRFLFRSNKTGFQLLVFGVSLTDARQYAKNTHSNFDMKFISKNPIEVNKYLCCATTSKQIELNRISLERLLEG